MLKHLEEIQCIEGLSACVGLYFLTRHAKCLKCNPPVALIASFLLRFIPLLYILTEVYRVLTPLGL